MYVIAYCHVHFVRKESIFWRRHQCSQLFDCMFVKPLQSIFMMCVVLSCVYLVFRILCDWMKCSVSGAINLLFCFVALYICICSWIRLHTKNVVLLYLLSPCGANPLMWTAAYYVLTCNFSIRYLPLSTPNSIVIYVNEYFYLHFASKNLSLAQTSMFAIIDCMLVQPRPSSMMIQSFIMPCCFVLSSCCYVSFFDLMKWYQIYIRRCIL